MVRRHAINSLEPQKFGWQKVGTWSFYLPSPEQIREECEVIQARWSRRERVWRRLGTPGLSAARRKTKSVTTSDELSRLPNAHTSDENRPDSECADYRNNNQRDNSAVELVELNVK
jgi:hypothetical protein